ncbi:MAG TPA: YhjD/YihY/BrkB family envelope integrity protein, partial [Actinomycetota bacterium]|nr:YhjD/YihY/BrkB family envelope integrity protein [Actinomycetota bacterium]
MLAALKRIAARVKEAPGIRTVIAVQKRYGEDQAGLLASSITYHGFLSLFPLMLVALSVAGFVLQDFEARRSFTEDMASAVPGLRTLLGDSLDALVRNRRATGIVGLGGLLWTGL